MKVLFTIIFNLLAVAIIAQPCSGPGRTPQTAIPVCGTLNFTQASVTSCTGGGLANTNCTNTTYNSNNAVWYKIHCVSGGTLGFSISPNTGGTDIDWALLNITGHNIQDVFGTNLYAAHNFSGLFGTTGASASGVGNFNCANGPAFNERPVLISDNDYLLLIKNFSNNGQGYSLQFTGGTAVLIDDVPPVLLSAEVNGCNLAQVKLRFSKDISCSSISSDFSEFSVSGGTYSVTGISTGCSGGNLYANEIVLNLSSPLVQGVHSVSVVSGSDGNLLMDVCGMEMLPGNTKQFSAGSSAQLAVSDIIYSLCEPKKIKVVFSKKILCNSLTPTGSEFTISPVLIGGINSVLSQCSPSVNAVDTITLLLQSNLLPGNYQLNVFNGTDGNTILDSCSNSISYGYSFPFSIQNSSNTGLIASVTHNECKPKQVVVKFSKPVFCNTISPFAGTEFSIGGGNPVVSIGSNCSGGKAMELTLLFQNNLSVGPQNLVINNGTDGNTISDTCLSFIPVGSSYAFNVPPPPPPAVFTSVDVQPCNTRYITAHFSKPLRCGTIFPNGWSFQITGPSPVNIALISSPIPCSTTSYLTFKLVDPIAVSGQYTIKIKNVPNGPVVADTCGIYMLMGESFSFYVNATPSANFVANLKRSCFADTIHFTHPGGADINSYSWSFSDGTTYNTQNVDKIFPLNAGTIWAQLIVAGTTCKDTVKKTMVLNHGYNAAFSTDEDSICIGTPINFSNQSVGSNLYYQWLYGDNSIYNGTTPPPYLYANAGTYVARLIATNDIGCSDTASKTVFVASKPIVSISNVLPIYCTGQKAIFKSQVMGYVEQYLWETGNNYNVSGTPVLNYTYNLPGTYRIKLIAENKFCERAVDSVDIVVNLSPVVNLGSDITLCPETADTIGVKETPGFSYLWSTGETTSYIRTGPVSGNYMLSVTNNGCTVKDDVYVRVMSNCLIKVPGAFTPNGDGLNDYLKAVNADLARDFNLKVYNRYGNLVFETSNPIKGWDGKLNGQAAEAGTYVWMVSFIDPLSGKKVFDKGTSILIR